MSCSRTAVAATALLLLIAVTGCQDEKHPTTDPSPSTSSPILPSTVATAWSGGRAVPIEGDENVHVRWDLEKGVDPADPVVEVARRTVVLMQLGYLSGSWTDPKKIAGAVSALTVGDVVSATELKTWTAPKVNTPGTMRVLLGPPSVKGDAASVLACLNTAGVPGVKADRYTAGVMTRIDLTATAGTWRVSRYNQNTAPTPRDFFKRCKAYGAPQ